MSEKGSANLRFAEDAFEESRVVGAQDFLYGQKYDSAIKQGLRTQMGLTEILDSGDCKEAWERCGAEEAATATDGPGQAGADNEEADSYPLAGSVAAPGQLDKYVPDEDNDLVQEAEEETVAEVDSYLSLVSCSHGGEEKSVRELAGELRALSLNAVRGSEHVLQSLVRTTLTSRPRMGRTCNLDACVTCDSGLPITLCRYVLFDGGRPHLHNSFMSCFKQCGGMHQRILNLVYTEDRVLACTSPC